MPGPDIDESFALALQHHQGGRLAEAEKLYRSILQAHPEHSDSLHLLGVIALQTGNLEPAHALIQRAVRLRPDGAVYWNNLGLVLERLGRNEDATRAFETAKQLDPAYAEAFNNLGHVLERRGLLTEAETQYRKAIELQPDYAEPHTNIGNLLKDRGELDSAIEAYRRAIELRPDLSVLHSNLLLTLHYHPDYSPADLAREHREWAARHADPLKTESLPHENERDPDRRLRLGYVSPDFREHAVTRFLLPLLENHDHERFEVFAYSDVSRPDEVTEQIRANVDKWHDVEGMNDGQLAELIRRDRIDILVDLAAHSGRNRLLVFARKPAPVQVTYLAYCSTTGVDAMDYRLTDRFLDPLDEDLSHYAERSVRLPDCYWCYSAPRLPQGRSPSTDRLPGPPTFGCLNNFAKVTAPTLRLWIRLLQEVPDARLLLYARADRHRARVKEILGQAGVSTDRLSFMDWQPFDQYLETYREIDVALDPFPYTGGTTSCDALWMGVPVVTLAGRTAVSRGGASLLSNAGLERLVARSEEQYIDLAAGLIQDLDGLTAMRRTLRSRLESSPVMDTARFTGNLEAAFRDMWRNWCSDA